jgi:hypothetical protein
MVTFGERVSRPFISEPSILVIKEKHGDRYFNVPDDKTLFAVALMIVTARLRDGWWYEKPSEEMVKRAVEAKDGRAAYDVLRARRNAEYEGFSIERFESFDGG